MVCRAGGHPPRAGWLRDSCLRSASLLLLNQERERQPTADHQLRPPGQVLHMWTSENASALMRPRASYVAHALHTFGERPVSLCRFSHVGARDSEQSEDDCRDQCRHDGTGQHGVADGLGSVSFTTSRYRVFVVSTLSERQLREMGEALAGPIARRLAGA